MKPNPALARCWLMIKIEKLLIEAGCKVEDLFLKASILAKVICAPAIPEYHVYY